MNTKPTFCLCNDIHMVESILREGRLIPTSFTKGSSELKSWCMLDGDTYAKCVDILPHSNMKYIECSRLGKLKYGLMITSEQCCKTNATYTQLLFDTFGKETILDMYAGCEVWEIEAITERIRDSFVTYYSG